LPTISIVDLRVRLDRIMRQELAFANFAKSFYGANLDDAFNGIQVQTYLKYGANTYPKGITGIRINNTELVFHKFRLILLNTFMKNIRTKKFNDEDIKYYKFILSKYSSHIDILKSAADRNTFKINPDAPFNLNISRNALRNPLFAPLIMVFANYTDWTFDPMSFDLNLSGGLTGIKNLYDQCPDIVDFQNEGPLVYSAVFFTKFIMDALDGFIVRDEGYYKIISLSAFVDANMLGDNWLEAHMSYMFKVYNTTRLPFTDYQWLGMPNPNYSFKEDIINKFQASGKNLTLYNVIKKLKKPSEKFALGGPTSKPLPSTNPFVWDMEFSVGDIVKIRIDMVGVANIDYTSDENKFEVIEVIPSNKYAIRAENPSGKMYEIKNSKGDKSSFEGKDLELISNAVSSVIIPTQTTEIKVEVEKKQYEKDYEGDDFVVYKCENIMENPKALQPGTFLSAQSGQLNVEKKLIIDLSIQEKFLISINVNEFYMSAIELSNSDTIINSYEFLIKAFNLQRDSMEDYLKDIKWNIYTKKI